MNEIENCQLNYISHPQQLRSKKATGVPAALNEETGAMFVETATRVGFAYAASLVLFAVLMHVAA